MKDRINQMLEALKKRNLSPEERAIMRILYGAWQQSGSRVHITQRDLAKSEAWLGCHETHEGDKVQNPSETTLRKVRQIIRDLRLKHNAPILSDRDGYWIPSDSREVQEYLQRIEQEARSQAAAWFETYKAMKGTFGVQSAFFEGSQSLFEKQS